MSALSWFKLPDGQDAGECSDALGHDWSLADESGEGWKHVAATCKKCGQVIDFWQRERPQEIAKAAKQKRQAVDPIGGEE